MLLFHRDSVSGIDTADFQIRHMFQVRPGCGKNMIVNLYGFTNVYCHLSPLASPSGVSSNPTLSTFRVLSIWLKVFRARWTGAASWRFLRQSFTFSA